MTDRIMIAAPGSASGKTTITCALLAALRQRGLNVVSFKCGPDYIDPMFHQKVTRVPSYNLDSFLMSDAGVLQALHDHADHADLAVLEGVMGLYDGLGNTSEASSNHVSLITETPVVLVVDARGAALSLAATIQGFLQFAENNIRAVILNNTSASSYEFYRQIIQDNLAVPVIGYLPTIAQARIESRHLGLVTADEISDIQAKISLLADQAAISIDLEALLAIAHGAPDLAAPEGFLPAAATQTTVRIAVASDAAFCFWYQDNHELLNRLGAELVFFSPIKDQALPDDIDGLILWGGYPELYAPQLSGNHQMLAAIRAAIADGLPVYAECGGFMYLQQSLADLDGNEYPMLAVLPGRVRMSGGLSDFGYFTITALRDSLLAKTGSVINTHFFHHSVSDNQGDCFMAVKRSGKQFACIVSTDTIFAGYQHLHFWGNWQFAGNFVEACQKYQTKRGAR